MSSADSGTKGNIRQTLAAILGDLREQGLSCALFGGWAEELLGLREPGTHGEIDLVYCGKSFAGFDAVGSNFSPVPLKRFHHKRAFLFGEILCEIILVQDADHYPVTPYWGDVAFHWELPLLHPEPVDFYGESVTAISAANLRRHRRLYHETQPDRWRDPKSLVP